MLTTVGPWTFGWEALVAIGTIGLAAMTYLVARRTRKLAVETTELAKSTREEIQAEWRPVILPFRKAISFAGGSASHLESLEALQWVPSWTLDAGGTIQLRLPITNAGRGPALFIRVQQDPSGSSPNDWSRGSLAPGEAAVLIFQGIGNTAMSQVLIDYRDLAGQTYSTAIVLSHLGGDMSVTYYDVRHATGRQWTTHGDAVPQPGLRVLND